MTTVSIHLFIHQALLSTCHMPATVLDAGDTAGSSPGGGCHDGALRRDDRNLRNRFHCVGGGSEFEDSLTAPFYWGPTWWRLPP